MKFLSFSTHHLGEWKILHFIFQPMFPISSEYFVDVSDDARDFT